MQLKEKTSSALLYTADNVAPTLGTTYVSGFTIIGSVISGTGNIYTTITDATSGVNVTQCKYA